MYELDACGLQCPLPLLKAKQMLNRMAPGEQLRVLATDPGSLRDFQVFCQQSGNTLQEQRTAAPGEEASGTIHQPVHVHLIRKAG